ncbi:hypothetical protein ERJ75_000667000 [Trypanosoma vivax]|nr:hypothetical protein ERJ75_000667000 [Trypanosoma vivax]
MLEAGTWDTSATLEHAVALAVQAAREWKQVAPLMARAKKAANKGLYALKQDVAGNISDLTEGMGDLESIGSPDDGGGPPRQVEAPGSPKKPDRHSPQTSLACARAQTTKMNALRSKAVETSLTPESQIRARPSRRGRHSENTALPPCAVGHTKDHSSQQSRTSRPCSARTRQQPQRQRA